MFSCIINVICLYIVIEGTCGLVDIIENHRSKSLDQDVDNTYQITVRCTEIWKDAIQSFKRYFDESKHYFWVNLQWMMGDQRGSSLCFL